MAAQLRRGARALRGGVASRAGPCDQPVEPCALAASAWPLRGGLARLRAALGSAGPAAPPLRAAVLERQPSGWQNDSDLGGTRDRRYPSVRALFADGEGAWAREAGLRDATA